MRIRVRRVDQRPIIDLFDDDYNDILARVIIHSFSSGPDEVVMELSIDPVEE